MLSVAIGYDPRYLTREVARGTENYYTREVTRGEPPGIWTGNGCSNLGLTGQIDETVMQAVYTQFIDPRDPHFQEGQHRWRYAKRLGRPPRKYATAEQLYAAALAQEPNAEPERREALRRAAEQRARAPVAFIDVTFGVPKSVSILHSALRAQQARAQRAGRARTAQDWAHKAQLVERAIWEGNNAALQYLQQHAGYSRAGYHGTRTPTGGTNGRWIDAHDWIIGSFFQHTNRNEEMHLHIHNAILNRVECTDGAWRTLDSRAIHRIRGAAGAIAERVMTERLIATLGVEARWCEAGYTLELAGVSPQARALFSTRRRAVTDAVKTLAQRFKQRHGRPPNALELAKLSVEAAKSTRAPKRRTKEDLDTRLNRYDTQLRTAVDQSLEQIAREAVGRARPPKFDRFDAEAVITAAVEQVQATKNVWTRFDLIRALNSQLPPSLGGLDHLQVTRLLEALADRATAAQPGGGPVVCLDPPELVPVPDELCLHNGRSVFEAPAESVYTSQSHLATEERLIHAASRRLAHLRLSDVTIDDARLGADQAAAIRGLLCSDRHITVLVGPAGAGKSFVLGQVCHLWEQHTGGRVIGLATAQRAALVLEDEGYSSTENVARWLQRQDRLANGSDAPTDLHSRLGPADLVVVDEAAMTTTAHLAEIEAYCSAAGARLILAGDAEQLSAVGAGGGFRLVAQHTITYTLDEVRRFDSGWEREASLRLRDGDISVLSVYDRHGRLVDGGTAQQAAEKAARAWLADTLGGRQSLLLVATGEEAADLSARLRAKLVALGRVSERGAALRHEAATGTIAGVGDIVQTRRNDWRLTDSSGRAVVNRDLWRVEAVAADGGLRVRRFAGRQLGTSIMELPADYVSEHVTLGYAVTVHSGQGATVDTCYPVVTSAMSRNALYVAMTRGRIHSVAHVVTAAPGLSSQDETARRTPGQVLSSILERSSQELPAHELRDLLLTAAGSLPVLGSCWSEAVTLSMQARFEKMTNQLCDNGVLSSKVRSRLLTDESAGALQRLLRTAELGGKDPHQLLSRAIQSRELDSADSVAQVLHHRIVTRYGDTLLPYGDTWRERTPAGTDPISVYACAIAEAMDTRAVGLGELAALEPPEWAIQHLGPLPHDSADRRDWIRRVGTIAAFREQFSAGDETDVLGPSPKPGLPDARAAWFAAWRALGSPPDLAAESTMAVPALVAAVQAYERARAWAPDWVGDQLRTDAHRARKIYQRAQVLGAKADGETDDRRRTKRTVKRDALLRDGDALAKKIRAFEVVDDARSAWYAHTEPLRRSASRAAAELARRGRDPHGQPRRADSASPQPRESIPFTGDVETALAKAAAAQNRIRAEQRVGGACAQQKSQLDLSI